MDSQTLCLQARHLGIIEWLFAAGSGKALIKVFNFELGARRSIFGGQVAVGDKLADGVAIVSTTDWLNRSSLLICHSLFY